MFEANQNLYCHENFSVFSQTTFFNINEIQENMLCIDEQKTFEN